MASPCLAAPEVPGDDQLECLDLHNVDPEHLVADGISSGPEVVLGGEDVVTRDAVLMATAMLTTENEQAIREAVTEVMSHLTNAELEELVMEPYRSIEPRD